MSSPTLHTDCVRSVPVDRGSLCSQDAVFNKVASLGNPQIYIRLDHRWRLDLSLLYSRHVRLPRACRQDLAEDVWCIPKERAGDEMKVVLRPRYRCDFRSINPTANLLSSPALPSPAMMLARSRHTSSRSRGVTGAKNE